jgi:hypothetical protein
MLGSPLEETGHRDSHRPLRISKDLVSFFSVSNTISLQELGMCWERGSMDGAGGPDRSLQPTIRFSAKLAA